jgi:biofilm protein TabA
MICCPLSDAGRYAALHPLFHAAFTHAADAELAGRDPGRYELGGGLYVNLGVGDTEPANERRFESHHRYIDIQVLLSGPERIQWAWTSELAVTQAYDDEADIAFHAEPPRIAGELVLQAHELAIFYPEHAHRPCCNVGDDAVPFRKLVFKVPLL